MNFPPFTAALVLITVLISIPAFSDERLRNKLILWPRLMNSPGEYYRLLASGFIHEDMMHLAFNMITLYFMGRFVEYQYSVFASPWLYIALYITGIVAASLPSFAKHRNNPYYRALGASGGVSAVLFACVYFDPWQSFYFYFIPIGIPSIIFAVLYLVYSAYMSKKGTDNIGHDAHFWGAVYGLVFTFLMDPGHGQQFFEKLIQPHFGSR